MKQLQQYPYLRAALEDYHLLEELVIRDLGTRRHAVILMYDVIEFALYEVLVAAGTDIYRDGQHTIGLDSAISKYNAAGYSMPLIGSVRRIQKLRGDAKHHAQTLSEDDFVSLLPTFNVLVSRLVHEHFASALGKSVESLRLVAYHSALYESYRKYRNHNWDHALRFAICAVLHKLRKLLDTDDDCRCIHGGTALKLVGFLEKEIETARGSTAPKEVIEALAKLPEKLRISVSEGDIRQAAEQAGQAYSLADKVVPGIFDMNEARRITNNIVQPASFDFGGPKAWTKWRWDDTEAKHEYARKLKILLKRNPSLIESFGNPYYEDDGDRYWRWWEFAMFDGSRWHSFHIDDDLELILESHDLEEDTAQVREQLARLILAEFKTVAEQA